MRSYYSLLLQTSALLQVAHSLSRLSFNDKEKQSIKADLETMISFGDNLNERDLIAMAPSVTPYFELLLPTHIIH